MRNINEAKQLVQKFKDNSGGSYNAIAGIDVAELIELLEYQTTTLEKLLERVSVE